MFVVFSKVAIVENNVTSSKQLLDETEHINGKVFPCFNEAYVKFAGDSRIYLIYQLADEWTFLF